MLLAEALVSEKSLKYKLGTIAEAIKNLPISKTTEYLNLYNEVEIKYINLQLRIRLTKSISTISDVPLYKIIILIKSLSSKTELYHLLLNREGLPEDVRKVVHDNIKRINTAKESLQSSYDKATWDIELL